MSDRDNDDGTITSEEKSKKKRFAWVDAAIDSLIVGGISALATGFLVDPLVSGKVAIAAFTMSFLIKLQKVRTAYKTK